MSSWTLIICEGAHDAVALSKLACGCGDWQLQKGDPAALPVRVEAAFPRPTQSKTGTYDYKSPPKYLHNGDRILEIRPLGGDAEVLGKTATDFLEQFKPDAVGVVVDADDKGVESRVQSFRNRFKSLYPHAADIGAGDVLDGQPRLGLWVAPDNRSNGRMDELILKAAARANGKLITCGKRFANSLAHLKSGKWEKKRDKAILGAVGQTVLPGVSLAVVLDASGSWFPPDLKKLAAFRKLLEFIEALAASGSAPGSRRP